MSATKNPSKPVTCLALSGGVGGAKLALGLYHHLPPAELAIAANVGDDFEHLGLTICPDIDTLSYTLADLANFKTGWGRTGDTSTFMSALADLAGETWFHLGDGDLAIHVARSHRLRASNDPVRTLVNTADGPLNLQHYFVREKCAPIVTGFQYDGTARARTNPEILAALSAPTLRAVVICPSNPFISIDPILALAEIKPALRDCTAPIVAVSPVVGGTSLKGPTAKMMQELGKAVSAETIARHYGELIDGFVLDQVDAALEQAVRDNGMSTLVTPSIMNTLDDKIRLAKEVFAFAASLTKSR